MSEAVSTTSEPESSNIEPVTMAPVGRVQGIKVVLLGSGGPPPDPERSGPAVAVLSHERAYLVDLGPGLVRRAVSAHEVLSRHRGAAMLIVARANVGPAMLRYVDATIGCLREAGFTYVMADHAWNAIDSHVYGFTLQTLNFPFEPGEYAQVAKAFLPMIPADQYPWLTGLSPPVIGWGYGAPPAFELGLGLNLYCLERLRCRGSACAVRA